MFRFVGLLMSAILISATSSAVVPKEKDRAMSDEVTVLIHSILDVQNGVSADRLVGRVYRGVTVTRGMAEGIVPLVREISELLKKEEVRFTVEDVGEILTRAHQLELNPLGVAEAFESLGTFSVADIQGAFDEHSRNSKNLVPSRANDASDITDVFRLVMTETVVNCQNDGDSPTSCLWLGIIVLKTADKLDVFYSDVATRFIEKTLRGFPEKKDRLPTLQYLKRAAISLKNLASELEKQSLRVHERITLEKMDVLDLQEPTQRLRASLLGLAL